MINHQRELSKIKYISNEINNIAFLIYLYYIIIFKKNKVTISTSLLEIKLYFLKHENTMSVEQKTFTYFEINILMNISMNT